ncbi:MAG TPA: hypothetical protein VF514_04325, partial [Bacteroidota bacterium]
VLFIPLIFALVARLSVSGASGGWKVSGRLIPAMAVLVMAAPINYKALQYSAFPVVLLAYPQLYAGLALLWCACALNHRPDTLMESSNGNQPA